MKKKNKPLILFIALILSTTLACNISIEGVAPEVPKLELTITAQALLLQQAGQTSIPAVIVENPTTAATSTLAAEATPTTGSSEAIAEVPTSTSSTVTVTVSAETNCRTGPSINFPSKYSLPVGQVAEVTGKNTLTNYWIIKIPGSGSGSTCWLWGKYATVSGNVNGLPEVATPAPLSTATRPPSTVTRTPTTVASTSTSVSTAPAAPSALQITKSCVDNGNGTTTFSGVLSWKDNSNNEVSFFVLYPGNAVSVPPNQTSYALNFTDGNAVVANMTFIVQASGIENSAPVNISVGCP